MREYDVPFSKTKRSSNKYFINDVHEWNVFDETVRNSATLAEFKSKSITSLRPVKNSLFGVFDICGVKKLAMLRREFSTLNEHRFSHNFQCISPMCACNTGIEYYAHFFLHYPLFDPMRYDLLNQLAYLSKLDFKRVEWRGSMS